MSARRRSVLIAEGLEIRIVAPKLHAHDAGERFALRGFLFGAGNRPLFEPYTDPTNKNAKGKLEGLKEGG
jgi:hypothetical protein